VKLLDLFSGLGGFSYGLERVGFKTVAFCDNNKYCNLVLQKHWKGIKIYNDVKKITKERLKADGIPTPDIITGGFPCQPFSVAGKQKGTSDDRYLWPEMFRIIKELKPRWVIGENVKGLVNLQDGMVFETVCTDLEGEGYEVRAFNIPAAGVGAPHRRERIWIVAHRKESMVNTDDVRLEQHNETKKETSWWRTSTTFEPTSDVVNPNNDGSPATTQSRSFEKTSNNDQEGQNKTSKSEGTSGRERNENMENSRRTLQQRTELREKNEDEVKERYANQHQRSGSTSESNVANANKSISRERQISRNLSDEGRRTSEARGESLQSEDRQTRTDNIRSSSEDVANAEGERTRENNERLRSRTSGTSRGQETSETQEDVANAKRVYVQGQQDRSRQEQSRRSGWWHVEPDVGRVAHGVSGRVHRLKGLGNSIVPKIAEEIGRAIMKAERD